ncbi:MAG: hypothetical protein ACREM3_15965 [Candidatus Rokuibacteriota bacterium]
MALPERGRVLGIDVGWSHARATTGLCVLAWGAGGLTWTVARARGKESDRRTVLRRLLGGDASPVLAVAVDGPLRPALACEASYRAADALLSRGRFAKRGKVAQTNSGSGRRLHEEACRLTALALEETTVAPAHHACAIHDRAVVEAFPNLFLGVLCDDADYPDRPRRARQWTDDLYELEGPRTQMRRRLAGLLRALTGRRAGAGGAARRAMAGTWDLRDHDERAGLVCALAALCVVAGRFVAVGSPKDGWIVLPPADHWGRGPGRERWAWRVLQDNLVAVAADFPDAAVARHGDAT